MIKLREDDGSGQRCWGWGETEPTLGIPSKNVLLWGIECVKHWKGGISRARAHSCPCITIPGP